MVGGSVENTLTGVFFCFFLPHANHKIQKGVIYFEKVFIHLIDNDSDFGNCFGWMRRSEHRRPAS